MDIIDSIVGMAIAVDIRVFVCGFHFLSRIIFWFSLSVFVSTGQNKHPIPSHDISSLLEPRCPEPCRGKKGHAHKDASKRNPCDCSNQDLISHVLQLLCSTILLANDEEHG